MYKNKVSLKKITKKRKRKRIRKKIGGVQDRPRVHVFKSNRYIYAQAINDENGSVLASVSSLEKEFREKSKNYKNIPAGQALGEMLARRLKKIKIEKVVFDRGIYPYHGRIKALAEAMRKGGLTF